MNPCDVKEVFDTKDYVEANKKLKDGFEIVKMQTAKIREEDEENVVVLYVLAK